MLAAGLRGEINDNDDVNDDVDNLQNYSFGYLGDYNFSLFCPYLVENRRCDFEKTEVRFSKKACVIFRNRICDFFN